MTFIEYQISIHNSFLLVNANHDAAWVLLLQQSLNKIRPLPKVGSGTTWPLSGKQLLKRISVSHGQEIVPIKLTQTTFGWFFMVSK